MKLLVLIVFCSGIFVGWKASANKAKLKAWIQKHLRKANEQTKNL